MVSILRTLVAGPRLQHEEAGLDLCYVSHSDPIIMAMSMPAAKFPKNTYRNPIEEVIAFLDRKHGDRWSVWEFRAEGAGYTDAQLKHRVFHAPFPDHHPPPFALIPNVVASMRNHLLNEDGSHTGNVVVVHCKAGKGRSGTMTCAYLIAEENHTASEAMARFTAARMRPGWGEGVSIPSQVRWVNYIEQWTRHCGKAYVERRVRIREVHVWGLRPGVRLAVQGYVEEGKEIKTFHTFTAAETREIDKSAKNDRIDVIFQPKDVLYLPTNDVNIDFERRSSERYGLTVVTSVAHVWFNAFFEGGKDNDSGVFDIDWEDMDGIKGTYKKGFQALTRVQVVWSAEHQGEREIWEPTTAEEIHEPGPASPCPVEGDQLTGVVESVMAQNGAAESPSPSHDPVERLERTN